MRGRLGLIDLIFLSDVTERRHFLLQVVFFKNGRVKAECAASFLRSKHWKETLGFFELCEGMTRR